MKGRDTSDGLAEDTDGGRVPGSVGDGMNEVLVRLVGDGEGKVVGVVVGALDMDVGAKEAGEGEGDGVGGETDEGEGESDGGGGKGDGGGGEEGGAAGDMVGASLGTGVGGEVIGGGEATIPDPVLAGCEIECNVLIASSVIVIS